MNPADDARLKKIVEVLRLYAPEEILLFGSYARGDQDAFSDVDLVIIKETEERFLDRIETVYRHIRPDFALDALVYTPDEFAAMQQEGRPFAGQLIRDGIVIYRSSEGQTWQPPARLSLLDDSGTAGQVSMPGRGRHGSRPSMSRRDEQSEQTGWRTMKQEEGARSRLEQAQADLAAAEWLLAGEDYHAACFWAQQVAEKALKAFLYRQGERHIVGHSIYRLGQACAEYDPSLAQLAQDLGILDRFYIPTRYPNGLPLGGVPAQIYNLEDAQRALDLARRTIENIQIEGDEN